MLQQVFGNLPAQMGDYASDAQTQNILNQLFMQHQNQGPPPASEDAVSKLPRIKITDEHIGIFHHDHHITIILITFHITPYHKTCRFA